MSIYKFLGAKVRIFLIKVIDFRLIFVLNFIKGNNS